MQQQTCRDYRVSGKRWSGPKCAARQSLSWANPSNRPVVRSTAMETASAALMQATNEQPPCPNFTDVNRHNFKAVLPVMRAAIQEATFVAIDGEFTGLFPEGPGEDPLDDYDERYKRVLASADNYLICQFGLSAFKWHAAPAPSRGGHWEAKTFNAYIFPRPDDKMGWDKRFLCQASSLSYLAEQGFDFNKMIHDGIGFVPLHVRDSKVRSLREELDKTQRMREVRGPEEEALVEAARRRVLSWLLGGEQELLLQLPATRRLRTLLQLLLQEEFQLPSLGYDPFSIDFCNTDGGDAGDCDGGGESAAVVMGDGTVAGGSRVGGSGAGGSGKRSAGLEGEVSGGEGDGSSDGEAGAADPQCMRLRRLDHWRPGNLIASGQQLTPRQRIEMMVEQCGFSQVLDILRDAGRPLVGHNATFDLAYTLSQFNGSLPRTWRAYKALLQRAFPGGLYDTKHIATQLLAAGVPVGDSGLGNLYRTLMDEQWLRANVPGTGLPASLGGGVPEIRHAPGFSGYAGASTEKAHEAGFDAFMTGSAFVRLLRLVTAKAAQHNGGAAAEGVGSSGGSAAAATADAAAAAAASDEADSVLQPLGPYRGRVHFMRSDLPYADMYGTDPSPSRPAVVHVSGFGAQTRASFVLQRFASLGFPPVQVCMLTAPNGAATGALVQLPRADMVPRAIQAVRKKWSYWNVTSFAEYYHNRQQQRQLQEQQQEAGTSGAGSGAARAPPRFIRTVAAGVQQQQQRSGDGSGAQGATEGGSAAARVQRKDEGSGGAAAGPAAGSGGAGSQQAATPHSSGSGAASDSSDGPASGEEQPQQQQRREQQAGTGVVNERQRLQAFTQMVAAVAASTSGTLQSRSSQKGREGSEAAAPDGQTQSSEENTGAASFSDGAATVAPTSTSTPTSSGSGGRAAESEVAASRTIGSGSVVDVEAGQRAATRLRSLALAAQRLKGTVRDEPKGGAAEGGGGLALQRPGRPTR